MTKDRYTQTRHTTTLQSYFASTSTLKSITRDHC